MFKNDNARKKVLNKANLSRQSTRVKSKDQAEITIKADQTWDNPIVVNPPFSKISKLSGHTVIFESKTPTDDEYMDTVITLTDEPADNVMPMDELRDDFLDELASEGKPEFIKTINCAHKPSKSHIKKIMTTT